MRRAFAPVNWRDGGLTWLRGELSKSSFASRQNDPRTSIECIAAARYISTMTNDLILSDPEIMGGTPCIRGTRMTVYAVEARLRTETPAELIAEYPHLTLEEIEAANRYAIEHPFVELPDARPWRHPKQDAAE